MKNNIEIVHERAEEVNFNNEHFHLKTKKGKQYKFNFVLGAYGKRDKLDKTLDRKFIKNKFPWVAVKAHYKNDNFPLNKVELHNFKGGYCGLSANELNVINVCYLVSYKQFKKYNTSEDFKLNVLYQNPFLKRFLVNSKKIFERELTIAQVPFANKNKVQDHILMLGDTAAVIHPLCGNGMAMAMHSAKLVSEIIPRDVKLINRKKIENSYRQSWNKNFKFRMFTGKIIQQIILNKQLCELSHSLLSHFPSLFPKLIAQTHGKKNFNEINPL